MRYAFRRNKRLEVAVSQSNRTMALCLCVTAGLGTLACVSRSSDDRPHELPILGHWTLETIPPESSPGRMMLEVRVDSVTDARLHGHLVHYFTGDVGVDSSAFPHFDGEIRNDSVVRLVIRSAVSPTAGFHLTGVLHTDTIPLTTFVVGPDTLSGPDRYWILVRREH